MSTSTSIWVRRFFSALIGLLALYCILLDFSWGIWEASHGGAGYGIVGAFKSGISHLAAQIFNFLHVTNNVNFLLAPIDLNQPLSGNNLYALIAYIVGLTAAVVWAGAGKDSREIKEIDAEIRKERRKKQRAGEEVAPLAKKPVYEQATGSISLVDFQNWLWVPIIGPVLAAVILKLLGFD